jgi:hypothetical protein
MDEKRVRDGRKRILMPLEPNEVLQGNKRVPALDAVVEPAFNHTARCRYVEGLIGKYFEFRTQCMETVKAHGWFLSIMAVTA